MEQTNDLAQESRAGKIVKVFSLSLLGGTVVRDFESLLAPITTEERAEDAADLEDLRIAEHEASHERPYFI